MIQGRRCAPGWHQLRAAVQVDDLDDGDAIFVASWDLAEQGPTPGRGLDVGLLVSWLLLLLLRLERLS